MWLSSSCHVEVTWESQVTISNQTLFSFATEPVVISNQGLSPITECMLAWLSLHITIWVTVRSELARCWFYAAPSGGQGQIALVKPGACGELGRWPRGPEGTNEAGKDLRGHCRLTCSSCSWAVVGQLQRQLMLHDSCMITATLLQHA